MSDGRVSVLLETESTYLFVGGGVSTWCNILVMELPQVDYHIYAIYRYFLKYDHNVTFKSHPVRETFKDEMLRPYREHPERFLHNEYPNLFDLATTLRWLCNTLMCSNAPVVPALLPALDHPADPHRCCQHHRRLPDGGVAAPVPTSQIETWDAD